MLYQHIPTLYLRQPNKMEEVQPVKNPDCLWVWNSGRAIPTRLHDGELCQVTVDGGQLVKLAKYRVTRHGPQKGGFIDYYNVIARDTPDTEAYWVAADATDFTEWPDGRHECVALGPDLADGRENAPAGLYCYQLAPDVLFNAPILTFKTLRSYLEENAAIMGILWYDAEKRERTAQLRRTDFGLPWPVPVAPQEEEETGAAHA